MSPIAFLARLLRCGKPNVQHTLRSLPRTSAVRQNCWYGNSSGPLHVCSPSWAVLRHHFPDSVHHFEAAVIQVEAASADPQQTLPDGGVVEAAVAESRQVVVLVPTLAAGLAAASSRS
jgi:hypothetical protein